MKSLHSAHTEEDAGADPGLKTSLVLSNGDKIENQHYYRKYEDRLSKFQRAGKKKQVRNIHRKIANKRKDDLHKKTTEIAKKVKILFIGNVKGSFLQKTNGKSSSDASVGTIQQLLKYKAVRHSGRCLEVNESSSTITCSGCLEKTGPSGLSDMGVREWTCSQCGCQHDRDINAAQNILRLGRESLKQPNRAA